MSTYDHDMYDEYEEQFNPLYTDRQARRKRKVRVRHQPKKSEQEILDEIVDDTIGLEGGFQTTYTPGLFEEEWLLDSLRIFYDGQLITDVLARIKGGKEASVYCCRAHPSTGKEFLAAKVYRPRKFRNLRNDKLYRQGRQILKADGKAVKSSDHRIMRAVGKKSAFGVQVSHTSWLMHEFTTLKKLHQAGAAVPQPFASGDNALLMEYIGDEHMAAPILNTVSLESDEVKPLFQEVLRNIDLMLQYDLIHGDLSAYNILYWDGKITLIDFPQVVDMDTNDSALMILRRDIQRICDYFSGQGMPCDAFTIAGDFWSRYGTEPIVEVDIEPVE